MINRITTTVLASLLLAGSFSSPVMASTFVLSITTQPSGAVNNVAFVIQPVVEIKDNSNKTNGSDNSTLVTVSLASGTGTLSGTLTKTTVNGVASFSDLKIVGSGAHTLTFAATGLTPVVSASFTITAGAATKLAIVTQPAGAVDNNIFTAQPVIEIRDSGDNVVTTATNSVSVTNNGPGTLQGNLIVSAVNGIATFTDLKVLGTGSHTVTFAATGLTSILSASFTVVAASIEDDMLTFSIGARNGTVGTVPVGGLFEIAVTVPFGTDVTNLVASFTVSPGAVATILDPLLTTPTSGVTVTNFTDPVRYRVTAENGTAFTTYRVIVTVAEAINSPSGGGSPTTTTPVSVPAPELVFSGKKWTITKNDVGVSMISVNLAKSQAGKTAKIYKRTKKGKLILLGEQRLGENGRAFLQTEKLLRQGQKVRVQVDGRFRSTITIRN